MTWRYSRTYVWESCLLSLRDYEGLVLCWNLLYYKVSDNHYIWLENKLSHSTEELSQHWEKEKRYKLTCVPTDQIPFYLTQESSVDSI